MIVIDMPNRNKYKKRLIIIIVYRITGPLQLPAQYIMLIAADFNLDQVLPENVAKVDPLIQNFNLSQRSQYSTQIHGGLLNLVCDNSNSSAAYFLPSPYSEHFDLFFQIRSLHLYTM